MKRSERKQAKQELREATQTILGDIIVGLRKKADLSQEDLAYESGVDRSFMSKKYEEALMNWLKEVDDEDKRIAVHVIFEMMGDSKNVYDLLLKGGRLILNGKKTWDEYTPQQRIKARRAEEQFSDVLPSVAQALL